MSFKIITTHPVGMRTFTTRDSALRTAEAFGIPIDPERSIVKTGSVLVGQRQGD